MSAAERSMILIGSPMSTPCGRPSATLRDFLRSPLRYATGLPSVANTSPLFPRTEACTFGQLHRLRDGHFDKRSLA